MTLSDNDKKAAMAAALFATWVALVMLKVEHAEDLIGSIKLGLMGLGVHHLKS